MIKPAFSKLTKYSTAALLLFAWAVYYAITSEFIVTRVDFTGAWTKILSDILSALAFLAEKLEGLLMDGHAPLSRYFII